MKLIFATNNKHKIEEVKTVLPEDFKILTLKEAGIDIDIPEPHDTLEDNAKEKAITIYHITDAACFSEDTGLEVFSLNGEPGVHSARYAGEEKSFDKNIDKLLDNLKNKEDKSAQFRAVICLIMEGNIEFFEGICKGKIISEKKVKMVLATTLFLFLMEQIKRLQKWGWRKRIFIAIGEKRWISW